MKLKVFCGHTSPNQVSTIVAAENKKEAAELLGINIRELNTYWAITGNAKHITIAESRPKTIFKASGADVDDYMDANMIKADILDQLVGVFKIKCFVCEIEEESDGDYDETSSEFSARLQSDGWRTINSKYFQTIGMACPKCVRTRDSKRGEL
jgi:hypothetical protein